MTDKKYTKSTSTAKLFSQFASKRSTVKADQGPGEELGATGERDGSINVIKVMKFRKPSTEKSSPKRNVTNSIDSLQWRSSHTKSGSQSNSSLKTSVNPRTTDSTVIISPEVTFRNKLKLLENKVRLRVKE